MTHRGLLLLLLVGLAAADPLPLQESQQDPLDDCFKKDSIGCVQSQLFRKVRSFFDQEKVELFGGLSLVRNSRDSRALDESKEVELSESKDAEAREELLESYAAEKFSRFLEERSLSWDLRPVVSRVATAARSLADSVPADVKEGVSEFVEGRGKKKKLLKALLPLLIGLKVKLAAFAGLAYVVIALIAKKALLASLISLAISGFVAIRKLLGQQQHHHAPAHHERLRPPPTLIPPKTNFTLYDIKSMSRIRYPLGDSDFKVVHPVEYSSHGGGGGGGWSAGGSGGGWDSYSGGGGDAHGSYSNNVAHSIAYGGQKPVRRR